jgi:hypothetical protein
LLSCRRSDALKHLRGHLRRSRRRLRSGGGNIGIGIGLIFYVVCLADISIAVRDRGRRVLDCVGTIGFSAVCA